MIIIMRTSVKHIQSQQSGMDMLYNLTVKTNYKDYIIVEPLNN